MKNKIVANGLRFLLIMFSVPVLLLLIDISDYLILQIFFGICLVGVIYLLFRALDKDKKKETIEK